MLKGNVFKNQIFENHIFALFVSLFLNKKDGIARDYKNGMNVTYSGHEVTVNSGACIIQGRPLEEDSSTTIDAGIETMFCKLVVEIDLDKVNTSSVFNQGYYNIVKSESAYPNLTQQDIVGLNSGKYQHELARFKISDGVVADFEDKRTFIEEQLKFEPIAHADEYGIYGYGDGEKYGHTKVINHCNLADQYPGHSLNAYQGYLLNRDKAPNNHASLDGTYGLGDFDYYGHARIIDNCITDQAWTGLALHAHQGFVLDKKIDNRYNSVMDIIESLNQRVSALERR